MVLDPDDKIDFRELKIPANDIIKRINTGGEFFNENGLIFTANFKSLEQIMLASVGYDYHRGAPNVCFFNFNL